MKSIDLIKQEIERRIDCIVDPETGIVDADHTQEYYALQELEDFIDLLPDEKS